MRIPMKYCKEIRGSSPWQYYVIEPVEDLSLPEGYEMHYLVGSAKVEGDFIVTTRGNEYSMLTYMYEYSGTSRHDPHKRYRFSEDEMYIAYGRAEDPNFDQKLERRMKEITEGTGSLVRAEYPIHTNGRDRRTCKAWFISPDESKWLYALDYDPLRDEGDKHRKTTESITILEEYPLRYIKWVRDGGQDLIDLLNELSRIRDLCIDQKEGNLSRYLANTAYSGVSETAARTQALRFELDQMADQMVAFCAKALGVYKHDQEAVLIDEIRELSGIRVQPIC